MHRRYQMARIIKVAYLIHDQPRQWTRPRLAERFEVAWRPSSAMLICYVKWN